MSFELSCEFQNSGVLVYSFVRRITNQYSVRFNKYKTFSALIYIQLYQHEWNRNNEYGNTMPEERSVFIQFRIFPTSTSVHITVYQYLKNVLYLFYNITMPKARRIRKISVFTSGGKFSMFTLSYVTQLFSVQDSQMLYYKFS